MLRVENRNDKSFLLVCLHQNNKEQREGVERSRERERGKRDCAGER